MHFKLQKQYRLKNYDYSSDGYYFVTICTENHEEYFGDVKNYKMQLSKIGKIAQKCWLEIPDHFQNTKLNEFVVMPNHLHGIVIIDNCRNAPWRVPTKIQPLIKNSLSSIINHYKGAVKRYSRKNQLPYFAWQPRFHERVIRNNQELNRIRNYIISNPEKWEFDRNNPDSCEIY